MNNKNIAILTIGIIVLAIAVLILIIFKGENMWKWMKENVCCFGKKEEIEIAEDVNDYGSINNDPYANQPALKALINSPFEENIRKIDEQYKKEKAERERERAKNGGMQEQKKIKKKNCEEKKRIGNSNLILLMIIQVK